MKSKSRGALDQSTSTIFQIQCLCVRLSTCSREEWGQSFCHIYRYLLYIYIFPKNCFSGVTRKHLKMFKLFQKNDPSRMRLENPGDQMFKKLPSVPSFNFVGAFVLNFISHVVVVNYLTLTSITSSSSIPNWSGVSLPFSNSPSNENLSSDRASFLNSQ